jgi:hypothetical protein
MGLGRARLDRGTSQSLEGTHYSDHLISNGEEFMQIIQVIRKTAFALVAIPAVMVMTGCDEIDKMNENAGKRPVSNPANVVDMPGNAPSTPAPATPAPATPQTVEIVATQPGAANPTPPEPAPPQPAPTITHPTYEKAGAGQGVQGSGYGGGIITEPVHQYFNARDRITFDIQIPKQLQIWKAMNNNRNPKNVEEYKKEILDPCQIELPELPPGKRYVYDAKKGELLVESGGPAK